MINNTPDTKNLFIAMLLSMLILLYWQFYIENPRQQNELRVQKSKEKSEKLKIESVLGEAVKSREILIQDSPHIAIKSDSLHGSIDLQGLHFNNLTLANYQETLDKNSPEVVLLSPLHSEQAYFAQVGWLSEDKNLKLPTDASIWKSDAPQLTPATPLTLTWENEQGVIFAVHIAMDEKYLFTLNMSAKDKEGKLLSLQPYAFINRTYDLKKAASTSIMHEGPIGVFDGILKEEPYKKLVEQKEVAYQANAGWFGIADKYWLTAFIPTPQEFTSKFSYYESNGLGHYQVEYMGTAAKESEVKFFAGAKELALLDAYSEKYNIPLFDHAVDLGLLDFLTKPIFKLLTYFYSITGNFGVAILLLTVLVKACMFPLANKSFKSMNQTKKIQPKMVALREKYKDDKMKLNQEMIELYKREKVNPASGCLPLIIQAPIFFALYKALYVTIEMRHAPFFGWIHDLSAPDPSNLFTLFGLLNWNPPSMLHLGIWPIIMCLTMVIQQHQSPPPADPAQAKMMKFLPFLFLFVFNSFAAGLVIYSSWSNMLTILQQWFIKRKHS